MRRLIKDESECRYMNLESNFRKVVPYTPGTQPSFADMVKLNTNENPYPPAPAAGEALRKFNADTMRLYPPVDAGRLRSAIAEYHGVDAAEIFVGIGSDDVLSIIFQTCFNSGEPVLFPNISYSFYEVWADLYRVPYRTIPLKDDFTIDIDDYDVQNGGIIIANPNAPTSVALRAEAVEKLIARNPGRIVVVDEAYIDFGGESVLGLVSKYPNLIVVRTYSKSRSMAGIRIGYAIASPGIIKAMEDVKFAINSYTINMASIETGIASLKEETYFRDTVAKIVASREKLVKGLAELGFTTLESCANFVFTTHASVPAEKIFRELEAKHIFVRYWNKPLINNYLRITVGTDEQIEKLFEALRTIIGTR